MNEDGYVNFLRGQGLSVNGIATRKNMAKAAENIIGKSLDEIVADDREMHQAILRLQEIDNPAHTPRQNALRKYYTFKNGREFPRVADYEKTLD